MTAALPGARPHVDPALQDLVDVVVALKSPPLPAPWPAPGQSRTEWLAEVAAARAEHMRFGREHRERAAQTAGDPAPPVAEVSAVHAVSIPVDGGSIGARIYTPIGNAPFPAFVMFHGGGFWIGGEDSEMDEADGGCRMLCSQMGVVLVNVDYRQAPEHKFPGPLEDCYAATAWVAAHAAELGVDAERLTVGGPSAGGNLAAGVSRLARDRSGPAIRGQVLMVPTTDATMSMSVSSPLAAGFDLTAEGVTSAWSLYLAPDADRTDPLISPLHASDLSGLPPAHVFVAELDPLHDEGVAYARRLQDAGVPTTLSEFHMTHALMTPDVAVAYLTEVVGAVRRMNGVGA